ncbi:MAG: hypothetical protein J6Q34_00670 [Bacteroidales bacterium]|nr:hypothetical protein [Bacteroidales bacterium]
MMEWYELMVDAPKERGKRSQVIYTFDIETTSLFKYPDGWDVFRPSLPPEEYEQIERVGVPYIWMFGIEADGKCNIYYGREFKDFKKVLKLISDPNQHKIIWVHNLAWETEFLLDIMEDYTITNLCARKPRKPIRYEIKELNIEFRCSYMLTGLSLEKSAEKYTHLRKRSGDLDYNILRHPKSRLSPVEMGYCEYDILTLHHIIMHYRDEEYGRLERIPLTQTGEVRRELRERVEMPYIWNVQKQTASSAHLQTLFMRAFMGGITHASYLHAGRILHDILSVDIASDYPTCMLAYKYPAYKWIEITPEKAERLDPEEYAILYHVILRNISSKYINTYILASKAIKAEGISYDNGRVISADMMELVVTEQDWFCIRSCYDIEEIEYLEVYCTFKDFLPKDLILYILDLYGQKTSLKGVTSADGMAEALYMKSKQRINSIYGCCVTSQFKGEVELHGDQWSTVGLSDKLIEDKLEELRNSRSNCFAYHWGIYCTAYARRRLFMEAVIPLDASVVGVERGCCYYDTDSCKAPDSPELREAVEKSNKEIIRRLHDMCDHYEIPYERLSPKDPDGVEHHIGLFEVDGKYAEFKALGAKRYAYRDLDGELHITVSGVDSRKGVDTLQGSLDNFKKNMIFQYKESGKMASFYNDEQPRFWFKDYEGKRYYNKQKHGICLQGVEYSMSIDAVYEALWMDVELRENRRYK